jgi:phosphoribosylaminoimidazole carboxylase (NCAIR synthetase)
VSKTFPTVGIIANDALAHLYRSAAGSLGIELLHLSSQDAGHSNLQNCDVVTIVEQTNAEIIAKRLQADGITVRPSFVALSFSKEKFNSKSDQESHICVLVARSPHGQATTWAPTQIFKGNGKWVMSITPAPELSDQLREKAQQLALDFSAQAEAFGVVAVEMLVKGQELTIANVVMHPHSSGNWTLDGSVTNQYEQHLRAVLDLPLGDPSMLAKYVVTGNVYCGEKTNMYRPYLHLMARTPALKFHQYKSSLNPGELTGHITLAGDDLPRVIEEIEHALAYMQAEIDE